MAVGHGWFAVIDGQFVSQWPVKNIKEKKFLKVPILIGSNTDEGISFGTTGVDTDTQAIEQLSSMPPPSPPNSCIFPTRWELKMLVWRRIEPLGCNPLPG